MLIDGYTASSTVGSPVLTGDRGRVRRHHILEIRRARGATYHGGAEEAVGRAGELFADTVVQQLEITRLSGDTVTLAP